MGFLRKKSGKAMLSSETALDRKGRVDGSSLLDGNGEPAATTLYNKTNPMPPPKYTQRGDENVASHNFPPPAPNAFGQTYPPQGSSYPQQVPSYPSQNGLAQNNFGFPQQQSNNYNYPQQPTQAGFASSQQYNHCAQQYGQSQQFGQYSQPPVSNETKKSSFFRLPGYGKKK